MKKLEYIHALFPTKAIDQQCTVVPAGISALDIIVTCGLIMYHVTPVYLGHSPYQDRSILLFIWEIVTTFYFS